MDTKLFELVQKHPTEFRRFLNGETDFPMSLYEELYEIFWEEMPYGTAKARTGDPIEWIAERLEEELQGMDIF